MKYLLDTDTCVFWLKGNERIEQKILSVGMDNVALSFINVSELYYGAYKSKRVGTNLAMVRKLTEQLMNCSPSSPHLQKSAKRYRVRFDKFHNSQFINGGEGAPFTLPENLKWFPEKGDDG